MSIDVCMFLPIRVFVNIGKYVGKSETQREDIKREDNFLKTFYNTKTLQFYGSSLPKL